MTRELKSIDISNMPELLRLAEEVRSTNEPRVLRRNSEDVAIVMPAKPVRKTRSPGPKSEADHDAFLASAGSWKGLIDVDAFKAYIDERRRSSSRPPVEL